MQKKACRVLYWGTLAALLHYLINLLPIMIVYFRALLQPLDEQIDALRMEDMWESVRNISTVNLYTFLIEVIAFTLIWLALRGRKEEAEETEEPDNLDQAITESNVDEPLQAQDTSQEDKPESY